ncbi:hypothetical protein QV08_10440 [Gallibacterium salpingitidis]|uniref:DUF3375 domain-containing protein n=1 Tax=Gallibacterium salpingitidis TaxID=505341 RepID=A0AB36DZX1_9PAST|nr:DUF3375 domain-containing protein [Gallibacterium salpingitidis]OBX06394.1 hypothetical protein QV08_10440 [Gallibacterium salpingitidis]OBX07194.1 hypothetical protein QV09_11400 [Gallibacterium salpingitidis]WKS98928.1 DUF3375 domain-containing protein [Gallibacterium salpingitidis]
MVLDFFTLANFRQHHPAWKLLCSTNAPLIISFLNKAFIETNQRIIDEANLSEMLEDFLYLLREEVSDKAFPKSAREYLNDWADPENAWLRKFYKVGTDEAQFDLTPATEKAISWLSQLTQRQFIGTESRLLTLFHLLKEIKQGSEIDPDKRIAELECQKAAIENEILKIKAGELSLLSDTAVKERYLQFKQGAKELLSDFREVEHNFRQLDRKVRKQISLWDGTKGALLAEIMGERDAISDSDQGKSFRAFWEFLLSQQRQQEFTELLEYIQNLPMIHQLGEENMASHRIHYDWLEAGEHTQRTVAQLSQHLRRFLDDKAWLENRRIMEVFRDIENKVFQLSDEQKQCAGMDIADTRVKIDLPMERPLYMPSVKVNLANVLLEMGDNEIDTESLFNQVVIDKSRLINQIRQVLQQTTQISLQKVIQVYPLKQGLAELVTYLQFDHENYFRMVIDEGEQEQIVWQVDDIERKVTLPKIIFTK